MKDALVLKALDCRSDRNKARSLRLAVLTMSLVTVLTGCATPAPDIGLSELQRFTAAQAVGLGRAGSASFPALAQAGRDDSAVVAGLLAAPLDAEAAVRLALLNNPALQVTLGTEGVSVSDQTPAWTAGKLKARQQITQLSAQTRKAWVEAVASAALVQALAQVQEAAESSEELARRLARVGNWSRLQQARQQVLLADAASALVRAEEDAFLAREKLVVLLGLWGEQATFELPGQLPALPAAPRDLPDVERLALQAREDLRLATVEWQRQQTERRLTRPSGLWDAMHDAAQLRALAVQARSDARVTYQRYRSRYDLARHQQDAVLPLRQRITEEMLLRYNGMLSSVFDLLADTRAQAQAQHSAIAAQRDFWLADADLQALLAGVSPGPFNASAAASGDAAAAGGH